jgi:NTP pyrophosphatase (non-canonical NTP hydrolase)
MNENERLELYKKAIHDWGIRSQTMMVMEETGEMLNAMGKYDRGRANEVDVITELVDVWIMMEQMACFFGWEDFQKEKERKLERLKKWLDKGYKLNEEKNG